ncbi:MAG: AMP-binding protein, partial [Acidobacteria bacterium]|nr:AMP-binding protein [Acidobacteriota bacterium]
SIAHSFFDFFFYRTLRNRMGGKLRFFVSGGAPLNPDIAAFFYGAGMKIVEGYGLTETAPVLTANDDKELYFGSVGKPLENVEIKIDNDGEILAKGPNIMKGYFKDEKATGEVFTENGWFKTGDIGHFDEEGRLFITDRKKELIVTAGGKNVAPQVIEAVLKENKYVNQAVVIGDQKPYLTVLIYPHWENVKAYAERKMVDFRSTSELINHPQIMHLFDNVLKRANAKLSRFEQLKGVRLLENEMTIESGELTPTLKVKRRVILQKYKDLIESMYENSYGTQARTRN